MNFDFTDEQIALQDTVQRFVAKDYRFETRRAIRDSASGWSREVWNALTKLGVLAINIDEEHGGLGFGTLESGLVMQAFGAGLLLEPYLAGAVIAPALIRRAASADYQNEWLPRIAAGASIVILAHAEPGRRYDAAQVSTAATPSGDGYALTGHKAVVAHGAAADLLLVSARLADGRMGLFALQPDAPGVNLRDYPTLDGQRAADLVLTNAPALAVGPGARGAGEPAIPRPARASTGSGRTASSHGQSDLLNAIEAALDIGLAALCFEAVGIMEATVTATTDYLKTRRQFGQAIGRFQVLQHRMADMLLHLEQARSMSYLAAMQCRDEDRSQRQRVLSAAKVTIGQACRYIAQNAVQLHGGMGMADELIVSHWFKRLTVIEMSFGDTDMHLQRFARTGVRP